MVKIVALDTSIHFTGTINSVNYAEPKINLKFAIYNPRLGDFGAAPNPFNRSTIINDIIAIQENNDFCPDGFNIS
jgi:hypothetical protein